MCGRYYVSDDTAGEIEKMVQDLDRGRSGGQENTEQLSGKQR